MAGDPQQSTLSSYKIEMLERSVAELREANTILAAEWRTDNRALHEEIAQMKEAEAAKERQLLMVGITTLGGIVVTLFGVLWTYRSVIFK
ncbi:MULTISPECIES: hypothetical protein [unclassified Sulfitobacter]|jgi:hypothetical protein|uniref:hypothetical protein n=1 Tax=unclassified Sulfitobacter TaxID=196795 RepID=UPI0007C3DCCF|nr:MULTISPECIES: hypothetical protein [unclassified Sulfitobacter]KZX96355.1 hypothetical protein A3720_20195 [Sulfitobacter sp. HI0021]KZY04210.1 hypothetical protein A3722_19485 [Sulfitobacter sp. HI0027]KZZ03075.1 hypothetical protein A3747_13275 [Sulfitobacter sp. HI0076]